MRLALYQAPSPAGNIPAGLDVVQQSLMQAASDDIEMLVLPELFLPGYRAVSTVPPTNWENVEPRLSELCRTSGVGLTIGVPEYQDDKIYNTALALDPRGHVLARHRKIQLFGDYEARIFASGECYTTLAIDALVF
jgi:predicted amidohydrolase